jgi:hypothetical protein
MGDRYLELRSAGLRGQDVGVGTRIHESLMPIAPPHDVRRGTVLATHLDDLAVPGRRVDLVALGDQTVAHLRSHVSTMRLFAGDDKGCCG